VANAVTLEILGPPVAWQRPQRGLGGQFFTPKRTLDYEGQVAWAARAKRVRFGAAPVEARIELWTTSVLRGDLDNYTKAILDGLQKGEAFADDSQVISLSVQMVVGAEDKVVVHLRSLEAA
jgi:Holliday junction resolvase RusA-like endonuclease